MNNHFFSIYQRSVVLVNGKQEAHYVLCYGNEVICETINSERVLKEYFIRFIEKELIL